MNRFSDVINKTTIVDIHSYDPVYEGIVGDFLKATKDKLFSNTSYIERDHANYIKHIFTVAFISSLETLRFKRVSLINIVLNPNKVLKEAQGIFTDERIIKDISGHDQDNDTRYRFRPQDEGKITPIIDEILDIVKDIEKRLKKFASDYIERKYSTNPLARNPGSNKRIQESFLKEFNSIFMPTKKKISIFGGDDGKETDGITGSSKFEILAYKVIRALKRNYNYDIENTHIIPSNYDITTGYTIHGMNKNSKTEERNKITLQGIKEIMKTNGITGGTVNKVLAMLQKNHGYVATDKTLDIFHEVFYEAYSKIYKSSGNGKPALYVIADMMAEVIEDNDIASEIQTTEQIKKNEEDRDREEEEADSILSGEEKDTKSSNDDEDNDIKTDTSDTHTKTKNTEPIKARRGRGIPVQVVGNLEV